MFGQNDCLFQLAYWFVLKYIAELHSSIVDSQLSGHGVQFFNLIEKAKRINRCIPQLYGHFQMTINNY